MMLSGTLLSGLPEGVRSSQRLLTAASYTEVLSLHELGYVFILTYPFLQLGLRFYTCEERSLDCVFSWPPSSADGLQLSGSHSGPTPMLGR